MLYGMNNNYNLEQQTSLGTPPTTTTTATSNGGLLQNTYGQQQQQQLHLHNNNNNNNINNINNNSSKIGKIADYDPLIDGPRQIHNNARLSKTLIYSSSDRPTSNEYTGTNIYQYDTNRSIYGQQQQATIPNSGQQQKFMPSMPAVGAKQIQPKPLIGPGNRMYRALYDYEAQDTDEVSFREGDIIYEVDSIDSGWLTGRVDRTGKTGMLPANYVEKATI